VSAWEARDGWVIRGPSSTFSDQDLSDDWTEYDEAAECACSVMDPRPIVVAAKKK
jgi:hypothetical protein